MAIAISLSVPSGGHDDRLLTYSTTAEISLEIVEPVAGQEPATSVVKAPAGTGHLYVQSRRCGDFYAEFAGGQRIKSAIGPTRLEAVRNAAAAYRGAA